MPFPGILVGSELEAKIDRCVGRVVATGRDKSTAIAICRSSIAGASKEEATKDRADAVRLARYRDAGPASTQICATCKFAENEFEHCELFDFKYSRGWTCDRWLPNIAATQARLQELQAANKARHDQRRAWVNAARVSLAQRKIDARRTPAKRERWIAEAKERLHGGLA